MDLTQLFKACVKTIRLRCKTATFPDKSRLLRIRQRDEFLLQASDVRYQVTQLRDLLIENRSAYMRFGSHLKTSTHMSDEERNIIDKESETIFFICNQYLNNLQSECIDTTAYYKDDVFQHKMAILNLLYDYLENIFVIHSEQKGNRTQHELDTYKLLKLESTKNFVFLNENEIRNNDIHSELIACYGNQSEVPSYRDGLMTTNCKKRINTIHPNTGLEEDQANKFALDDENLSSDDIQVFESENIQLLNVLKGYFDEVEQIEKNVVGIARLQTIFTEKVTKIRRH